MADYNDLNPNGSAFGWDDVIENEGQEFGVLPEDDYKFTVVKFERQQHNGSEKIPPCAKAALELAIEDLAGNKTTVRENLFLHSKQEWKLCKFFTCVGMRRSGEKFNMGAGWRNIIGATGWAHITVNEYKGKDGNTYTNNKVSEYYDPQALPDAIRQREAAMQPAQQAYSQAPSQESIFPNSGTTQWTGSWKT